MLRRVAEVLRRLQNPRIEFLRLRVLLGTEADRDRIRITLRSDEVPDGEDTIPSSAPRWCGRGWAVCATLKRW